MLPLTALTCIVIGAVLGGQLWVGGPEGAAWYRFYIMVAGGSILGVGIMLILRPEAELASVIPAFGLAFLAGSTGITIGLLRKSVNQAE